MFSAVGAAQDLQRCRSPFFAGSVAVLGCNVTAMGVFQGECMSISESSCHLPPVTRCVQRHSQTKRLALFPAQEASMQVAAVCSILLANQAISSADISVQYM